MGQALVTKIESDLKADRRLSSQFTSYRLDKTVRIATERQFALAQIAKNDQLQSCTIDSIKRCLIDLSVMGLTLSPAMKLAYLIPYKSTCTLSPSYMGLEQMCFRNKALKSVQTGRVLKGDSFRFWTDDSGTHIQHEVNIDEASRGVMTHVWCIAKFTNGGQHVEVMTAQQVANCEKAAIKKNGGKVPFTWKGVWRDQMELKCVVRRGWKHWPKDTLTDKVVEAVERCDPMDFGPEKPEAKESGLLISLDQITELKGILGEAGFPEEKWDSNLNGLARSLGYGQGIESVLASAFEDTKFKLREGLMKWKAKR